MNWQVITGLRFLLAFFIICEHLKPFIVDPGHDFFYMARKLTPLGNVIGVILISGYLTAYSIKKNPEGFYKRRLLRLYPLYFCAIIISGLPFALFGSPIHLLNGELKVQADLGSTLGYLFFLQGFVVGPFSSNAPLWPLGVLPVTYALTPLFSKLPSKILLSLIGCSAALYVAVPYFYHWLYHAELPYYSYLRFGLPFGLFLWVWLLGFLYSRERHTLSARVLLLFGCLMLILNQQRTGIVVVAVYGLTCLVLIFSSSIRLPSFLLNFLGYLGNISYPVYLFHLPTFLLSHILLGVNHSLTLLFLALLVGMLFYHAVDLPLRSRRVIVPETSG
ncbi:acyltransferase [Leptolyngbya sp. FACHB-261]|uniref:acyltransferase family protein n=1 Tax=Leptolyngbya sp. FACHB-261 TaxID=2692806 RepID=UPI0016845424|nr:acyltransferase [Leptolyngbya sp. FACHB-261]MBD2102619.1 acyltransferase [Leptolyngbya sp. FACHB-261]